MGKSLIIKDADFSQNGIQFFTEAILHQGYVTTNPNNVNFGRFDFHSNVTNNTICIKIFIPSGKSAFIYVDNGDTRVTDLNLGYVASANDKGVIDDAKVNGIALYLHPADNSLRKNDGGFLVPNTSENDLYFYMNICYDVLSGPAFPVSGKQILYCIV